MPTRFIQMSDSVADTYTGSHAGIGVDSDTNKFQFNPDGTKRTLATDGASDLTATTTLTAASHGKTLFLNSATEFVTTLPALEAGLRFKFVVKAAPSAASYTVVTSDSANVIVGQVLSSELPAAAAADSETAGGDTITFVDGVAVKGDWAEVVCDGTNWYMTAGCKTAAAITITTAS